MKKFQSDKRPLADRIRPTILSEFVGQEHLVGVGKPLRRVIETGEIHSMIFWGPPGCGKTTLAKILAGELGAQFFYLSAVAAGKADVAKIINLVKGRARGQLTINPQESQSKHHKTILFLDEIHRFNKAQQDYLLPYVEDGTITLIGATTENPSFEVIGPLLSRCQVFVLEPLGIQGLKKIIERGKKELKAVCGAAEQKFLIEFSNGDARQLLNLLEATVRLYTRVTTDHLKQALQSKFLRYDRAGEEHYNTISAFIKSLRASNTDAALYYLARMVDAGEYPLFIARRMVIFASEDIGMARPTALVVANAVFRACETIGYPECAINLAHGVVYLAKAPKDRSSYNAYFRALDDVKKYGNLSIPMNLRNAPTKLMKELGYGKGYDKYTNEDLLPEKLTGRKYHKIK